MDKIIELIQETKNLTLQVRKESQDTISELKKEMQNLIFQFREEAKEDIRRHDKILARLESNETVLAQIMERLEQRSSDHERRVSDLEKY